MRGRGLCISIFVLLIAGLATAEEFTLKDGTKIVGKMVNIRSDSIEVETLYGKIRVPKANILSISFPENQPKPVAEDKADPERLKVEQSLEGTTYTNRTGKFKLTVPSGWKISEEGRSNDALAFLVSSDENLGTIVLQETFPGSLKAYKEIAEEHYKATLGGYQKLSEDEAQIDGGSASTMIFRAKPEEKTFKYMVALVPYDGGITRIMGFTAEPLFDEMKATLQQVILSYETTKD